MHTQAVFRCAKNRVMNRNTNHGMLMHEVISINARSVQQLL